MRAPDYQAMLPACYCKFMYPVRRQCFDQMNDQRRRLAAGVR